ncbi:MAG: class I SAM-dependent methyltransferase [Gammaproteobacteria bacterium]|nr:class I SAM-dependent methyltransferase [Gammaproteobacteria bacterium]
MSAHWQTFASRWNRLGPPMRPGPEDVANFQRALDDTPGACLLLGVTPELINLSANLIALDNSADMIHALWPRHLGSIQGDWLDMPFDDASFDNVIGDGCPVLLEFPLQLERFFAEVSRVLKPGGRLALRVFVCPEHAEGPEQVCAAASAGNIRSFHAFKWRLSMAIAATSCDFTFPVAETLRIFDTLLPDRQQLAETTGWRMEDIATIDFYRGSTARYSYLPLSRLRQALPMQLSEIDALYGSYELAERCPLLVLERRA